MYPIHFCLFLHIICLQKGHMQTGQNQIRGLLYEPSGKDRVLLCLPMKNIEINWYCLSLTAIFANTAKPAKKAEMLNWEHN